MSRAYRIQVKESVTSTLRAGDHVKTRLELLGVLPEEEMAQILRDELLRRGFKESESGKSLVRKDEKQGVSIEIDPTTAEITVSAEACQDAEISGSKEGWGDTDWGNSGRQTVEKTLRETLRRELEGKASEKTDELQRKVTENLERELIDLRGELDQIVNKVTADALKTKASRMGRIKDVSENTEAGSLTIVVEV